MPAKKRTLAQKIRYGCYAILLTLAVALWCIPGGVTFFRNQIGALLPTPEPQIVELPATPDAMGRVHGTVMKYPIRLLEALYIRPIIGGGGKYPASAARATELFAIIPERWQQEVDALAAAAGTAPEAMMLGNSFLDLGVTGAGCRQLHAARPDGSVLHSHNLDWDNLGGVGNFLVTIFRTAGSPDRFATVYMAFPGMIGALDIINEHGVALSFNQVGFSRGTRATPIFMAMRDIAETCATFEEAEKKLLHLAPGMPFCIGLTDSKSGKMAVFERDRESIIKREPHDRLITADNNLQGGPRLRRNTVDEVARSRILDNPQAIQRVLRHPKVMLGCNIYSVIFDYRDNALYLASGKVPAAAGTYRKYPLFQSASR